MRIGFRDSLLVIATAALVAGLSATVTQIAGQAPPSQGAAAQPRRGADGKPDFSGIWQANSTANWDLLTHEARPMVAQPGGYPNVPVLAAPVVALGSIGWIPPGLGVVDGNEIPYQPWAAARKRENAANWLDRDPELKCYLPGVPRAMYMPYPFQIFQGTNKVMMIFEFANAQRTIHMDQVEPYPNDAYMGHSLGRWDGDTLVVDVSTFTPYTWLDRSGDFHSDALHVIERYTPISRDAIQYEATIEDKKVYTRPWKISLPLYRRLEPNAQLMDFRCIEMVEETIYGHLRRQPLVRRWEGKTIIVDITRRVPPGEEAYERQWSGNPPEAK